MSAIRICDRCGERIDPGLFGRTGKSVYHLGRIANSEKLSACVFCGEIRISPLYEMAVPVYRPRTKRRGGGERNRREYG